MIDALLRFFSKDLTVIISDNIVKIYLQGSAEMITWGKTKGGIPIQYEGPPIDEAIAYAKKRITEGKSPFYSKGEASDSSDGRGGLY